MKVKITKLSTSPTQSGPGDNMWHMKGYTKTGFRSRHKYMDWASSTCTDNQVDIKFSSQKEAIKFAKDNLMVYEIIDTVENPMPKKSYSSNFQRKE